MIRIKEELVFSDFHRTAQRYGKFPTYPNQQTNWTSSVKWGI